MFSAVLALACSLVVAAPTVELRTLDGKTVVGEVQELSQREVVVQTAAGRVTTPADKLLAITVTGSKPAGKVDAAAEKSAVTVQLVDGSQLIGADWTTKGNDGTLALPTDGKLAASVRLVRIVQYQPTTPATLGKWAAAVMAKVGQDQIIVRRSEQTLEVVEGVIKQVTAEEVEFELDGETIRVKRPKVFGLVYYQPAGPAGSAAAAVCQIYDHAGMRLAARSFTLAGDQLQVVTAAGLEIKRPWSGITRLDFSSGKLVALSELEPEASEWAPYFAAGSEGTALAKLYAPRRDRSHLGEKFQLTLRDGDGGPRVVSFDQGVALHSRTRLVYRLPEGCLRFTALAGIDARVKHGGNVRLTIRADDKTLHDGDLRRNDPPVKLDLDVRGAARLTITVDYGAELDVGDHVNLCDARLTK